MSDASVLMLDLGIRCLIFVRAMNDRYLLSGNKRLDFPRGFAESKWWFKKIDGGTGNGCTFCTAPPRAWIICCDANELYRESLTFSYRAFLKLRFTSL